MDLRRHLLALQFADGFFQQPDIGVEAHRVDMAVLLAAQQIAGAAQFQIERGDLESGAQVAEFLQRRQPLAGDLASVPYRAAPAGRRKRGGSIGPRVPQLVQLGRP